MKKTYELKIEDLDYIVLKERDSGKSDSKITDMCNTGGFCGELAISRIDALSYFMSEIKRHRLLANHVHCYERKDINKVFNGQCDQYLLISIYCSEHTMKKIIKKVNSKLPARVPNARYFELQFAIKEHMLVNEHICLEPSNRSVASKT